MSNGRLASWAFGLMITGVLASVPAHATTINFATGQDGAGNIQTTVGALDANWKLDPAAPGNNPTSFPNVYVNAQGVGAGWIANGPASSWVNANPTNLNGNGNFTIDYTFSLAGDNLATAVFNNTEWTIDDAGEVVLNGHVEGTLGAGNYGSLHPITINPADLLPGTNELQIVGQNSDSLIEGSRFQGTLTISGPSAVPEPTSLTLLGSTLALLGLIRRRENRHAG